MLAIIFLSPSSAFANITPAPESLLAEMLIILAVVVFTFIGGGYEVLGVKNKSERHIGWFGMIVLGVVCIVVSMPLASVAVLVMIPLGAFGVFRGIKLILWGNASRRGRQRPEYLASADSRLFIVSGALLIVSVVVFCGVFVYGTYKSIYHLKASSYVFEANQGAMDSYKALSAYAAKNPKKSGIVTCYELAKHGLRLLMPELLSCSSDVMLSKGRPVSGAVRIIVNTRFDRAASMIGKPGAAITFDGKLDMARAR